jgi:hypothetical protein
MDNDATSPALRAAGEAISNSTPSLPWNFARNWWQPVATLLAFFRPFRAQAICR